MNPSTTKRLDLPHGPRRGERFEISIDDLDGRGAGRATLDALVGPQKEPKTYTFSVRKCVPGDVVRVAVESLRRRNVKARVVEFLEPSAMRIAPRCRHFGLRERAGRGCGGCRLQMLDYRHQLAIKERHLKRLLGGAGIDPGLVDPVRGMDEPWFYRNKMELSFGHDADGAFALGLHPTGYRYEVIRQEECFLQSEFSAALTRHVRGWAEELGLRPFLHDEGCLRTLTIREGKRTGQTLVELTTTGADVFETAGGARPASQVADAFREAVLAVSEAVDSIYWTQHVAARGEPSRLVEHLLHGAPTFREKLRLPGDRELSFDIHPRAFFQTNTRQTEVLYARVVDALRHHVGEDAAVLDLYCGTGTIGLAVSPWVGRVVGIELQPDAVENARANARSNGIENAAFHCGDVGAVLEELDLTADAVVVDPPRAGLADAAFEQTVRIDAQTMVYVSCNPEALARDLRRLRDGGWQIASIEPVDMFPHTFHVESVAVLTRRVRPAPVFGTSGRRPERTRARARRFL